MKFSMFTKHGALISPDIFNAIRQGLTKLGHTVTENEMDCDIPVIWSLLWNGRMMHNKSVWNHFRNKNKNVLVCLLYTSPSPRDLSTSRMPSSA